jgi:hypothetical protein
MYKKRNPMAFAIPALMPTKNTVDKYLKRNVCVFMPYAVLVDAFTTCRCNTALLYAIFNSACHVRKGSTTCCFWISELVKMFTGLSQSETKTLVVKAVKDLKTFGHIACKELEQKPDAKGGKDWHFEFTLKTYWHQKKLILQGKAASELSEETKDITDAQQKLDHSKIQNPMEAYLKKNKLW